jgi:hypothetical protein
MAAEAAGNADVARAASAAAQLIETAGTRPPPCAKAGHFFPASLRLIAVAGAPAPWTGPWTRFLRPWNGGEEAMTGLLARLKPTVVIVLSGAVG